MMQRKISGLTTRSRLKAFELAIRNGLARSFSVQQGTACCKWPRNYMCCRSRLRFGKPQVTSATRMKSVTKANVAKCFDIFEPVLRLINFSSHLLFNYDETVLNYFNIKLHPQYYQLFLLNHLFDIRDLRNADDIRHISSHSG
jgi:hypothetical protein